MIYLWDGWYPPEIVDGVYYAGFYVDKKYEEIARNGGHKTECLNVENFKHVKIGPRTKA